MEIRAQKGVGLLWVLLEVMQVENAARNITLCINSNSMATALASLAIAALYTTSMTFCLCIFLPL